MISLMFIIVFVCCVISKLTVCGVAGSHSYAKVIRTRLSVERDQTYVHQMHQFNILRYNYKIFFFLQKSRGQAPSQEDSLRADRAGPCTRASS